MMTSDDTDPEEIELIFEDIRHIRRLKYLRLGLAAILILGTIVLILG